MNTVSMKDSRSAQLEQLLLYRDRLKKDCRRIMKKYMQTFGALTVQVFETRISCIRKKKMIRYIQTSVNMGHEANLRELTLILKTEMEEYESRLEKLNREYRSCRDYQEPDEEALRQTDRMYREFVHLLHPDIYPETSTDPVLLDLWRRGETAYDGNDAEKLQELKTLAAGRMAFLAFGLQSQPGSQSPGDGDADASVHYELKQQVRMLEEEIRNILTSEPYICQTLLENENMKEKKLAELREELVSCRLYQTELDAQLAELASKRIA